MSGANNLRQRATPNAKPEDFDLWVVEYCKKNPFDNLANAVFWLDRALGEGERKIK